MKPIADVCLILEGTYPYVTGGVSAWVHNLLSALDPITFAILHISPSGDTYKEYKYVMPDNVRFFQEVYILSDKPGGRWRRGREANRRLMLLESHYQGLLAGDLEKLVEIYRLFQGKYALGSWEVMESEPGFQLLQRFYARLSQPEVSFLDFFWTSRFIHEPLLRILTAQLPPARVYHAICTGYAGLLSSLAKIASGRPLLLTEHGIYTREREIEIDQAPWIYQPVDLNWRVKMHRPFLRSWWIGFFKMLARLTYRYSDRILTICKKNQELQRVDGADFAKMLVVPNGIDVAAFPVREYSHLRKNDQPFAIGFVGRVVPIKDIKTLLRAIKILSYRTMPFIVYIIGPTDEDKSYFEECQALTALLEIGNLVHFTGKQNIHDYLDIIDVVVLTSISEGQPLSLLECNCAGIPAVATDVGACKEMLLGKTTSDRLLGPSGIITAIANPQQTAEAIYQLWQYPETYRQMAQAGHQRVCDYYDQTNVHAAYRRLYNEYIAAPTQQQFPEARQWPE